MGLEALGQKKYAEIIDNGVTLAQDVAAGFLNSRNWNWS
jgi:L-2,4-diaminobutyrate decarboxylase